MPTTSAADWPLPPDGALRLLLVTLDPSAPEIGAHGAVHELTESLLSRLAGFGAAQAHLVATLAERAADPTADPDSWLSERAHLEVALLAAHNPEALHRLIVNYEGLFGANVDAV